MTATPTTTLAPTAAPLSPDDRLVLPMPRRLVVQMGVDPQGAPQLRLFHERKEISFDDPSTFGFGQALARQERFAAGEACTWGEGCDWPTAAERLQALLDEGVLRRDDGDARTAARRQPTSADGERPSPLPPAPAQVPRSWDDAPALMRELTGRALDPAHLELVVPIFRVAHMSRDADGRQVGEANVFPPAMRLPVPTRWRECRYDGTRHRVEQPMNVSALKAMREHWPAMMAMLRRVRSAYFERVPQARAGWTVGHLERLSTAVLALPSWLLLQRQGPRLAEGALHPALSSLFRVTDGLRMTLHQMLFVPIGEPAWQPDAAVDADTILAYAERNYSFHSEHGVCAGPRLMIETFFRTVVDGAGEDEPGALDAPALQTAVKAIPSALDYGLRGLQAYAVTFSAWPEMARRYERLAERVAAWAAGGGTPALVLDARVQPLREALATSTFLATEDWRRHREQVYGDMLRQCSRALGEADPRPLDERLTPWTAEGDAPARLALRQAALRRCAAFRAPTAADRRAITGLVDEALTHLQVLRAVVAAAEEVQAGVNRLLGRPAPARPFEAADLDLHNRLQGATRRPLPFLIDVLEEILGCRIVVTATQVTVTPASAGMPPAERRSRAHPPARFPRNLS